MQISLLNLDEVYKYPSINGMKGIGGIFSCD